MSRPLHRARLFAAACAGIFVFGIVLALLGTLFGLPEMRLRLGLSLTRQGDLLLFLFASIFVASLIAGPSLDRLGDKPVLAVSSLLVGAALVEFTVARSFFAAAMAAAVLGLGGGGLNTSTNELVSELYGAARGAMLNLLGIFFGFGAVFVPLVAASVSSRFSTGQLLGFCAALSGLCVVGYLLLVFPPAREAQGFSLRDALKVARYPAILLFALLLFCQSGNEASMGGWISTYAGALGSTPRAATWVLAGYWAAMMLGRLFAAAILRWTRKNRVVGLSALASVVGCVVLVIARSTVSLAAGAVLTGLAFAAIYPTTLAMVGDRYERFAGTVFGFLFSTALIGGMLFPWGVGRLAALFGLRIGMLLPLAGAGTIALLALRVSRISRPAL